MKRADGSEPFDTVFDHLETVEDFAKMLGIGVAAVILVFSISVGISAKEYGIAAFARALCVSSVTVCAASATGALLGFLFGIPRLLQRGDSPPVSPAAEGPTSPRRNERRIAQERFFSSNTSFEEISDWLTKIIIGLGLTQFETVLKYLSVAALFSASYIELATVPAANLALGSSGLENGSLAVAVTFGLILTSLFAACLITYLETRTRLTALFIRMEAANHITGRKIVTDALDLDVAEPRPAGAMTRGAKSRQPVGKPATQGDRALTAVAFSDLHSATEMAAWGAAQARVGNLNDGVAALKLAVSEEPLNLKMHLRLAQALRLDGKIEEYIKAVLDLIERIPAGIEAAREAKAAMLDALYLDPPKSYEYGLKLGNYLTKSALSEDPQVWLYIAACRGQEYKARSESASREQLEDIRAAALSAVKKVMVLVPDPANATRVVLQSMYNSSSGGDDDLHIFFDDPEFQALLLPQLPAQPVSPIE